MKTWLRIALAAQVFFFLGWAGVEEWRQAQAKSVLLETEGYDPRDLISGQYLQLRYPIARVQGLNGFPNPAPNAPLDLWVLLEPKDQIQLAGRSYTLHHPMRVSVSPPESGSGLWARGHYSPAKGMIYGIERYYFSEARMKEFEGVRSGRVYVEVDAAPDGRLRIKELVRR